MFRKYWPLFIILIVISYFFTIRLGRDLFWDWDECLYAQYVKEMPRAGRYLTNIWNGYIDLQKPPLYTWLLQIPAYFGRSEFNLRLLNVTAALGLLTSLYVFAKRYFSSRVALLASLILLTAEVYVIYAMKLSTDMVYSLFIFLGVWSWIAHRHPELVSGSQTSSRTKFGMTKWLLYVAGIFFGLATMTKGLGTLQFLLAIFVSLFIQFKKERFIDFIKMAAMAGLVSIPWHIGAYLTYGEKFLKVYLLDNIIKRSKYPIEFHRERIWFYFVLIYNELKPWIFAIIIAPIVVLASFSRKWESRTGSPIKLGMTILRKNELIFTLLLLIVIPLIAITRVQTRIAWYILPIYPFLSIYLAYSLNLFIESISKKKTFILYPLYFILILFISADALRLILNETKYTNTTRVVEPRYEVMFKAKDLPYQTMHYLVAYGERGAKLILPPEETIDMTWVYGGNGCAVYYSDKKVNYYYETDKFENALKTQKGLFLIENGDSKYTESKKILFKNPNFTLFTN